MSVLKVTTLKPTTDNENLTPEDIKLIQNCWDLMKQDIKGNGYDLFINIFKNFPDYQKFFKSFANVPLEELPNNKRLWAHTNNVLYTLTGIIDSIEDDEVFDEMCERMAENHFRRKVQLKQFENTSLVIINQLIEKLGDEIMNQQTIDAWRKVLIKMMNIVDRVIKETEN